MTRVFRKLYPRNPVSLSNGKAIRFEDINGFGWFKTSDPVVIAELELAMKAERGGVSNATEEEYDAALKKKSNSLKSRGLLNDTQTSGIVTAVFPPQLEPAAAPVTAAPELPPFTPPAIIPQDKFVPAPKVGKRG